MNSHPSRRWIVLAYAVVMQAVTIGIGTYAFAFFVLPWMQEFGALRGTLMIAASGMSLATAVLSPFCGYLLDRLSSRTLVLIGGSTFALGLLGIAAAPSHLVIILIFIAALPLGVILSGTLMASTLVARSFTDRRGMALGIAALGTSLGGLVMPLLVTQVLAHYDWRVLFVVLAGLVASIVIVPAALILRGEAAPGIAGGGAHGGGSALMRSPAVLKLGVAFVAPPLLFVAVLHNLGALAADLSITQQNAAWIASTASLLMAASKVISGLLCDRVDHRFLYSGIVAILLAAMATVCLASGFGALLAGVSLVSIGAGATLPVITSSAAERWGTQNFGRVMGVVFAMAGLSGLGSLFAGALRDASGSYTLAFAALTVMLVPAIWCFFTLPRALPAVAPAASPSAA